ncbi:hypothetical protein NUSPORA_02196 [Nucleospora cyclopteri]
MILHNLIQTIMYLIKINTSEIVSYSQLKSSFNNTCLYDEIFPVNLTEPVSLIENDFTLDFIDECQKDSFPEIFLNSDNYSETKQSLELSKNACNTVSPKSNINVDDLKTIKIADFKENSTEMEECLENVDVEIQEEGFNGSCCIAEVEEDLRNGDVEYKIPNPSLNEMSEYATDQERIKELKDDISTNIREGIDVESNISELKNQVLNISNGLDFEVVCDHQIISLLQESINLLQQHINLLYNPIVCLEQCKNTALLIMELLSKQANLINQKNNINGVPIAPTITLPIIPIYSKVTIYTPNSLPIYSLNQQNQINDGIVNEPDFNTQHNLSELPQLCFLSANDNQINSNPCTTKKRKIKKTSLSSPKKISPLTIKDYIKNKKSTSKKRKKSQIINKETEIKDNLEKSDKIGTKRIKRTSHLSARKLKKINTIQDQKTNPECNSDDDAVEQNYGDLLSNGDECDNQSVSEEESFEDNTKEYSDPDPIKLTSPRKLISCHKNANTTIWLTTKIDYLKKFWISIQDSDDDLKDCPQGFSFSPGWQKYHLNRKYIVFKKAKLKNFLNICQYYGLETYFSLIHNLIWANTFSKKNNMISLDICFHLICYHFCTKYGLGKGSQIKVDTKLKFHKTINNNNFYKLFKTEEYWNKKAENLFEKVKEKAMLELGITESSFKKIYLYNLLNLIQPSNPTRVAFVFYVYHGTKESELDLNLNKLTSDEKNAMIEKRKILYRIKSEYKLYFARANANAKYFSK